MLEQLVESLSWYLLRSVELRKPSLDCSLAILVELESFGGFGERRSEALIEKLRLIFEVGDFTSLVRSIFFFDLGCTIRQLCTNLIRDGKTG